MQILCITEMINTLFECNICRFVCTRKILAEKMMSETVFFFLSCSLQELLMFYLFFFWSAVCSVNSELGN